jgi:nicotinamidase-related amidase
MGLLVRDRAALLLVDVQEGFRSYDAFVRVTRACATLLAGARILELPVLVSEQYPKGLGHTAPELELGEMPVIEKSVFSVARTDGFTLGERDQAIVCGIETHVCVSQTVHDLLDRGTHVHVPADAVCSRHEIDHRRGLERMERAGAVVSTVEAALFELLERAGTPEFKSVQKLII